MTKVQRDAHGQFVRTGGHIFRPEPNRWSYPTRLSLRASQPEFEDGTLVHARHISQTPCALVTGEPASDGVQAHWWSHGAYLLPGGKWKPSTDCWLTGPTPDGNINT